MWCLGPQISGDTSHSIANAATYSATKPKKRRVNLRRSRQAATPAASHNEPPRTAAASKLPPLAAPPPYVAKHGPNELSHVLGGLNALNT